MRSRDADLQALVDAAQCSRVLEARDQTSRALHVILERSNELVPGHPWPQGLRIQIGGDQGPGVVRSAGLFKGRAGSAFL
jgi:hypothetical protein